MAAWCKAGTLDGGQGAPRGPWWVQLTPEIMAAWRKPVRQYKPRRSATATAPHPGSHRQASRV